MAADSEGGGNSEKRESDGEREDLDIDRGAEQGHSHTHTHTASRHPSRPLLTYILMFPSQWHKWTPLCVLIVFPQPQSHPREGHTHTRAFLTHSRPLCILTEGHA